MARARRKKKRDLVESAPPNMTPMIDVVFQLLVFFMLVIDFSQTDLEAVQLPLARTADEDKDPDKDRVMINIAHRFDGDFGKCPHMRADSTSMTCPDKTHWKITYKGQEYKIDEIKLIKRIIAPQAAGMRERLQPDGSILSKIVFQIRADARAPVWYVQEVANVISNPQYERIAIYRMQMGAKQEAE